MTETCTSVPIPLALNYFLASFLLMYSKPLQLYLTARNNKAINTQKSYRPTCCLLHNPYPTAVHCYSLLGYICHRQRADIPLLLGRVYPNPSKSLLGKLTFEVCAPFFFFFFLILLLLFLFEEEGGLGQISVHTLVDALAFISIRLISGSLTTREQGKLV